MSSAMYSRPDGDRWSSRDLLSGSLVSLARHGPGPESLRVEAPDLGAMEISRTFPPSPFLACVRSLLELCGPLGCHKYRSCLAGARHRQSVARYRGRPG